MSKPRFGGLSDVMRGQSEVPAQQAKEPLTPEPDDEEMEAGNGEDEEEDTDMSDKEKKGAQASASTPTNDAPATPEAKGNNPAQGAAAPDGGHSGGDDAVATARAEERQRIADVFASEHVQGREMAAAELLAGSDMNADKITAMLPKLTPAASADDGKQMLAQMRENADPDLGNEGEADPAAAAADNHGWGKIHDEIRQERGL